MAKLELVGVSKTYRGGITAARDVDLAFDSGTLGVIVGPSGSGKSTLLRLIAGLESLDSGEIHLGGRRIDRLAPRDRGLAMVFQEAVVYPHLNVFANIAFGLRARRVGRAETRDRVEAMAGMLGLADSLGRNPTTLSGGQRRRVTLARALVVRPDLLLLDEPFAGLDAPLRVAIRAEIAELHRQTGTTMILVTHDQAEALALADRLAVFIGGQVLQVGPPQSIYDAPISPPVAWFVGQPAMALISCTIQDAGPDTLQLEPIGIPLDQFFGEIRRGQNPAFPLLTDHRRATLLLGLRPEHVTIRPTAAFPITATATVTVERLEPAGHEVSVTLRLGPHELATRVAGHLSIRVGDVVPVTFDLAAASWFDSATGRRIGMKF